jgi:nitrogen regulatory protein P-II 1
MQLITAIIRPHKVGELSDALQRFGFRGMTVTEAQGIGKVTDPPEFYRGREYGSQLHHHAKIEILAADLDVKDLVEVIRKVASTGRSGDGKVWVTPVTHVVRIRTGEAGVDAVR